jgi:hypothetical protein
LENNNVHSYRRNKCIDHVHDTTRLPRGSLEIKFKRKKLMRSRQRWFNHILEDIKNRGKSWWETQKENL